MPWISFEDESPPVGLTVLTKDEFYPDLFALGKLEDDEEESMVNVAIDPIPPDFNVTHFKYIDEP